MNDYLELLLNARNLINSPIAKITPNPTIFPSIEYAVGKKQARAIKPVDLACSYFVEVKSLASSDLPANMEALESGELFIPEKLKSIYKSSPDAVSLVVTAYYLAVLENRVFPVRDFSLVSLNELLSARDNAGTVNAPYVPDTIVLPDLDYARTLVESGAVSIVELAHSVFVSGDSPESGSDLVDTAFILAGVEGRVLSSDQINPADLKLLYDSRDPAKSGRDVSKIARKPILFASIQGALQAYINGNAMLWQLAVGYFSITDDSVFALSGASAGGPSWGELNVALKKVGEQLAQTARSINEARAEGSDEVILPESEAVDSLDEVTVEDAEAETAASKPIYPPGFQMWSDRYPEETRLVLTAFRLAHLEGRTFRQTDISVDRSKFQLINS